jgi:hypothetical protein
VSVSVPSFLPASLARLAGAAALLFAATLSAAGADPSPAAIQAAQAIVAGSGMSQAFDGVVPQMLFELERNTTATRPDIKDKMHETVLALAPEFVKTEGDIMQAAAMSIATKMSEQELKDTAAFLQSPSGKKYVATQAAVFQDVVGIVKEWRARLSTQMLTRAREEMRKKGVEF